MRAPGLLGALRVSCPTTSTAVSPRAPCFALEPNAAPDPGPASEPALNESASPPRADEEHEHGPTARTALEQATHPSARVRAPRIAGQRRGESGDHVRTRGGAIVIGRLAHGGTASQHELKLEISRRRPRNTQAKVRGGHSFGEDAVRSRL